MIGKIYVASAWEEYQRTRRLHAALRVRGFEITVDWTKAVDLYPDGEAPPMEKIAHANDDLLGVYHADAVLVLMPPKGLGCGIWHEAGAALALGRRVIYSGERHNSRTIFQALAAFTCATDDEAVAWLVEHRRQ